MNNYKITTILGTLVFGLTNYAYSNFTPPTTHTTSPLSFERQQEAQRLAFIQQQEAEYQALIQQQEQARMEKALELERRQKEKRIQALKKELQASHENLERLTKIQEDAIKSAINIQRIQNSQNQDTETWTLQ